MRGVKISWVNVSWLADHVYPVSFSSGLANVSQCKLTSVGPYVLKWAVPGCNPMYCCVRNLCVIDAWFTLMMRGLEGRGRKNDRSFTFVGLVYWLSPQPTKYGRPTGSLFCDAFLTASIIVWPHPMKVTSGHLTWKNEWKWNWRNSCNCDDRSRAVLLTAILIYRFIENTSRFILHLLSLNESALWQYQPTRRYHCKSSIHSFHWNFLSGSEAPLLIGQRFQAWAFLSKLQPHLFLQFWYLITEIWITKLVLRCARMT